MLYEQCWNSFCFANIPVPPPPTEHDAEFRYKNTKIKTILQLEKRRGEEKDKSRRSSSVLWWQQQQQALEPRGEPEHLRHYRAANSSGTAAFPRAGRNRGAGN